MKGPDNHCVKAGNVNNGAFDTRVKSETGNDTALVAYDGAFGCGLGQ